MKLVITISKIAAVIAMLVFVTSAACLGWGIGLLLSWGPYMEFG